MNTINRKEKLQEILKQVKAGFSKDIIVKHFARIVIQSKTKAIIKDFKTKEILVINKEDLNKYLITGGI